MVHYGDIEKVMGMRAIIVLLLWPSVASAASACVAFVAPYYGSPSSIERRGDLSSVATVHLTMQDDDATATVAKPTPIKRRKSWEESYALLCAYRDAHGHCNVPQSEKPLGTWVNSQRIEHSRYLIRRDMLATATDVDAKSGSVPGTSMTAEREQLLNDIGFVWDAVGHTWNTRYDELCVFRRENGHCVVPRSNGRLGAWVEKMRIEYKKYRAAQEERLTQDEIPKTILTEDRVKKLDMISFVWDVREKQFEQKLGQLRIFKEINGHIDPRYMSGSLEHWMRKWEKQYRKYLDVAATGADAGTLSSILPAHRREALEDVGFCRSMFDEPRTRTAKTRRATWEERYEELKEYRDEHGHCLVPKNFGPLGSWVRSQRHHMKEKGTVGSSFENGGLLSPDRVEMLNRLGFVWDVHSWQWNQTYHELVQYKDEHGDTNVPMSYGGLGLWVSNQRAHFSSYQRGKTSGMTPERIAMLERIGFEFKHGDKVRSEADERWQLRLDELKEYRAKWGTLSVKQNHNPSLYNWCNHQKKCWKNADLSPQREKALRSVGFLDNHPT